MTEVLASPWFIAGLFFFIAMAYSSVGLGGGSAYTALLALLGFSILAIPMISLSLNLIVTLIGSVNFIRQRHARFSLIFPFLITSMPMAYYGGSLNLSPTLFYWLLFVSLIFVAARIYLWKTTTIQLSLNNTSKILISLLAGSILGLVAGIVGIGGGIYLVPLIIILGLGTAKQAAACGSIFIFLNSLVGLVSRLQYNSIDLGEHIPLIATVTAGAMLGSFMGASKLKSTTMEKILGVIVLVAIGFLGRKLLAL